VISSPQAAVLRPSKRRSTHQDAVPKTTPSAYFDVEGGVFNTLEHFSTAVVLTPVPSLLELLTRGLSEERKARQGINVQQQGIQSDVKAKESVRYIRILVSFL
jgi:hypothetical protein